MTRFVLIVRGIFLLLFPVALYIGGSFFYSFLLGQPFDLQKDFELLSPIVRPTLAALCDWLETRILKTETEEKTCE